MKVLVGTKNPVKIKAVKTAFEKMFDEEIKIEGASVPSGVSDMPMSGKETYQGAYNRAMNSKSSYPDYDYYVGLEGGCDDFMGELGVMGWVVVISKDGMVGKGSGGMHFLPKKVVELLNQGYELGDADDMVFGLSNSKQEMGSIGILTSGALVRSETFCVATLRALIPHKNPQYFR
ncbi:MAG: Non-canonical purine NTP phosphatase [Alphaproteobacteria bacterium ADurb.Bin438]|nr:MAG: Non-canonical purine NTP phosphatase [Alphaproteobacteria bacterium ADurb.Bin438]